MTLTIRQAAGSLLIVGLSSTELQPLERAWLRLIRPSGIILFRRNIVDAKQTRHLLVEATSSCTEANLRCIDIEGGTVDRLRDAVAPMPSAQAVAKTNQPELMRRHGQLIAKEALAFGFNTTLAPVLDLALSDSAKVMGTRAVSSSPQAVTAYCHEFLNGLDDQGVIGCGKHFPGLGGGSVDSHLHTPAIKRDFAELWREDLRPYRELIHHLPMVMITHAAYPSTSSGQLPATASKFWVTNTLQKRMNFRGLIVSDDMEMGGILGFLPIEEAAIAAIRAGMHLIEICHSPELVLRAYESIIHEAERSIVFRKLLLDRAVSTNKLCKAKFSTAFSRALSSNQMSALQKQVISFGELVEKAGQK